MFLPAPRPDPQLVSSPDDARRVKSAVRDPGRSTRLAIEEFLRLELDQPRCRAERSRAADLGQVERDGVAAEEVSDDESIRKEFDKLVLVQRLVVGELGAGPERRLRRFLRIVPEAGRVQAGVDARERGTE